MERSLKIAVCLAACLSLLLPYPALSDPKPSWISDDQPQTSPSISTGGLNDIDNKPKSESSTTATQINPGIPAELRDLVPKNPVLEIPQEPAPLASPPRPSSASPIIAAPAAMQTTPKVSAPPSKPASKGIMLKGRLEEIGGKGATLPVGISLNLKTMTARMDPSVEQRIEGRVASFPTDWAGSYGGTITIWSTEFDPEYYKFDPVAAAEERSVMRPGTSGQTTINFYQQGNVITLEPPMIKLPMRQSPAMAKQITDQLQASGLGSMLGGANSQLIQQMAVGQPIMVLGALNGTDVNGNPVRNQVVKNSIRQLKPGVLEQDLLVQELTKNRQTGEMRRTYSETVLRFTKINSTQLYVQAASVKFRNDGHFMTKEVMYGTVTRGQGTNDMMGGLGGLGGLGGMMGLPGGSGGLPGMGGGAGGLGDLNNLLKQLQGQ